MVCNTLIYLLYVPSVKYMNIHRILYISTEYRKMEFKTHTHVVAVIYCTVFRNSQLFLLVNSLFYCHLLHCFNISKMKPMKILAAYGNPE